jgi:hypothetical protein
MPNKNFNTYYDQLEDYQQQSFKKFIKLHEEDKNHLLRK